MAIKDLIEIPENINQGVSAAKQRTMLALLGNPRGSYNQTCQPVQHPVLVSLITADDVGLFRATGLAPAIESLKEVMADIKQQEADVYEALGTAGMHCARFVRNSTTTISNHSWGTAIDLTLDGKLDVRGTTGYKSAWRGSPRFSTVTAGFGVPASAPKTGCILRSVRKPFVHGMPWGSLSRILALHRNAC